MPETLAACVHSKPSVTLRVQFNQRETPPEQARKQFIGTRLRWRKLLGFCYARINIMPARIYVSGRTRRVVLVVRGRLSVCSVMGEVRVSWSDGEGCWRVESPYLDWVWQIERDSLIWTLSPWIPRTAYLCIYECVVWKRGRRGNPFSTKADWLQRLWSGRVWGRLGRGRVGLHPKPTYRPLTPTLAYVFRISPQKKENIWGLWGLREFLGAPSSVIRNHEGRQLSS